MMGQHIGPGGGGFPGFGPGGMPLPSRADVYRRIDCAFPPSPPSPPPQARAIRLLVRPASQLTLLEHCYDGLCLD